MSFLCFLIAALTASLALACGGDDPADGVTNSPEGVRRVLDVLRDELPPCPVTTPNGDTPPGERPSANHHGNGKLWAGLYPEGTVVFGPGWPGFVGADGSLSMKFWWWRAEPGEPLTIEAVRLDAAASPSPADVPEGYGGTFQATALVFPTPGCWQVTGRAGNASLTFVTRVIQLPPEPDALAVVELATPVSDYVTDVYADAVLQAIDVAPVERVFRFATRTGECGRRWCEVSLTLPGAGAPQSQWVLAGPAESALSDKQGIAMRFSVAQMLGPASVRQALAAYEGGCEPEVLTLSLANGALIDGATHAAWYAYCPAPSGRVTTLRIDAQTGNVFPLTELPSGACLVNGC